MGVQQENFIPSICKRCVYQTTLYNSIVIISGFPSLKSCLMRTYGIMHFNEFIAGLIHAKYTMMSLKVTSSLIYTILLHLKDFFAIISSLELILDMLLSL